MSSGVQKSAPSSIFLFWGSVAPRVAWRCGQGALWSRFDVSLQMSPPREGLGAWQLPGRPWWARGFRGVKQPS